MLNRLNSVHGYLHFVTILSDNQIVFGYFQDRQSILAKKQVTPEPNQCKVEEGTEGVEETIDSDN